MVMITRGKGEQKKKMCIVFVIYGTQYEVLTSTYYKNNYIGDFGLIYTVWIIDFLQPNIVYVLYFPETAFVDEKRWEYVF